MWSNKVSTLPPWPYPLEDDNDQGSQFHPLTFGDHHVDQIWNSKISVGLVKMIFGVFEGRQGGNYYW